jgi:quinol monooxygenase YgiN
MGYVQIIEFKTTRFDEFEALHEKWLAETDGVRTTLSEHTCRDRDQPDTYVLIVEFPSYEEAMKNNDLPATARIAEGMAALADAPLTFRNFDLIRVD